MSRQLSKVKGMIFGLAIGDALGYPTEFMPLSAIKAAYGPSGIQDLPKSPALFTDDTQMTIAIAEALIKAGDQDLDAIMEAIRSEFIKWRHSPENNRAPGNACLSGVAAMERGIHWSESGVADSKGCGTAMRVAPIGYLYQNDLDKLKTVAIASGRWRVFRILCQSNKKLIYTAKRRLTCQKTTLNSIFKKPLKPSNPASLSLVKTGF